MEYLEITLIIGILSIPVLIWYTIMSIKYSIKTVLNLLRRVLDIYNLTLLKELDKRATNMVACELQYTKAKSYYEKGGYLLVWQTILGNIKWLIDSEIVSEDEIKEIKKQAKSIGKIWSTYGSNCIYYKYNYLNDEVKFLGLFYEDDSRVYC